MSIFSHFSQITKIFSITCVLRGIKTQNSKGAQVTFFTGFVNFLFATLPQWNSEVIQIIESSNFLLWHVKKLWLKFLKFFEKQTNKIQYRVFFSFWNFWKNSQKKNFFQQTAKKNKKTYFPTKNLKLFEGATENLKNMHRCVYSRHKKTRIQYIHI